MGPINERSSATYFGTLKDQAGVAVPGSSLSSAKLTLYDLFTGAVINNRLDQNVLNANNVTISEVGLITWSMQPADNAVVNDGMLNEDHIALFSFVWPLGHHNHEVIVTVKNLKKVSA